MANKPFLIAEIGQAHDGSLGILHSYIDALSNTGVSAVKFQTHIAEAESSSFEPFRKPFSYEDKTRFDYWKRMEFSPSQWKEIKSHCEDLDLVFISSPFSLKAVDLLDEIGATQYKIGSGEVSNLLLLHRIAETGKPVILSSGMSSLEELDKSVTFLRKKNIEVSVLQCTTAYPTSADQIGLNNISLLKNRYQCKTGLSDHSGAIYPGLAATTLGADILEFHVVFDKRIFGPDSTSSLTIEQVKQLSEGVEFIHTSLNNPIDKTDAEEFRELKMIFEKSLAINKDLEKDSVITVDDLETKKPSQKGIEASLFEQVIGKKVARDMKKWDFLNWEDVYE